MVQISKSLYERKGINRLVHNARILLILFGKAVPFILCTIVAISYFECLKALMTCDYLEFSDGTYLNKPISFLIGSVFELDLPTLLFLAIISVAVKTCKWNKMAILYLAFQLYEKHYFATHQWLNEDYYFLVIAANLAICLFLTFKGIRNL